MTTSVVWVDASSGASGDMLLAALHDAGVPSEVMADAARAVAPAQITFGREVRRGFAVSRAYVQALEADSPHRTWRTIRSMLDDADLAPRVRANAQDAFARLAEAEARVHGGDAGDIHFHEVGALDAIADIVGVCAGFAWLDASVVVGPIALGGGTARSAHGQIPVPVPAVLNLLTASQAPAFGGPVDVELCTPTGAALLTALASSYGPMPTMTVAAVGVGAGSRELPDRLGALRIVRGSIAVSDDAVSDADQVPAQVLETNIDDLDPRLWPQVLNRLIEAGASDAWLTPILMKKGRPAHTLHVLCPPERLAALQRIVFRHTSAIGLRTSPVTKTALARRETTVDVEGRAVRVKVAMLDGSVVNAQPEYDDVVATAEALDVPVKVVLAQAIAAIATLPAGPTP